VDNIQNGSYTAYYNVNLNGVNAFVARVASAGPGGTIQIYLDGTNGALVGTCMAPETGGSQTWSNEYCPVSGASGTHNVYLVFTGGSGNLFSLEYFGFYFNSATSNNIPVPV